MIRPLPALLLALPVALSAQVTGPSATLGALVPTGPGADTLRPGGVFGFGYQIALDRGWATKGECFLQTQRVKDGQATQGLDPSQESLSISPLLAWESPERGHGSFRCFAGPGLLRGSRSASIPIGLVPGNGTEPAHPQTRTVNLGSRTRGFLQAGVGYVFPDKGRTYTWEARIQRVLGPDERPTSQAMATLTFGW